MTAVAATLEVAMFVPMRGFDCPLHDPVENSDANDTLFDDGICAVW